MRVFVVGKSGSSKYKFAKELSSRLSSYKRSFPVSSVRDLLPIENRCYWTAVERSEHYAKELCRQKTSNYSYITSNLENKTGDIVVGIKDPGDFCRLFNPSDHDVVVFLHGGTDSKLLNIIDSGVDQIMQHCNYLQNLGVLSAKQVYSYAPSVLTVWLDISLTVSDFILKSGLDIDSKRFYLTE